MQFLFLQNQQTILEIGVISMSNIYQKVIVNCFKYECIYIFYFLYIFRIIMNYIWYTFLLF